VNDLTAAPLVFLAGVTASAGPCLTPRFVAAAGCAAADPKHAGRIVAAYLAGLIFAYAGLGYAIGLIANLVQLSPWTHALLAASFTLAAIAGLIRAEAAQCTPHAEAQDGTSLGAIFLVGASSALVLSPCCTPLVTAIGAYGAAAGTPSSAALLLAIYALGHGLPPAFLALGMRSLIVPLRRLALDQAAAIAGNAIMLVLAGYYWCLV
jgi:thiol:disulfide interchange protein DsbD